MWKDLFIVKEKAKAFKPHTVFYNTKFSGESVLVESSGKRVEKFLNLLYDVNPELIKEHVEIVEIDEDEPTRWAYIYVSEQLAKCITKTSWERITDMISATDIITAKLEYDLECIKKLAKN
jgi:hypothetical protein